MSPSVNVVSNWSRHALGLSLSAVQTTWAEHSRNDFLDLNASTTGRLDITRNDALNGSLSIGRTHELRSSPDAAQQNSRTSRRYSRATAR